MANTIIPALPRTITLLDNETIYIEQLQNAAYDASQNAFVGGEFKQLSMSKDGFPVWIRVHNDKLIVEQLYGCVIDKKDSTFVGGEMRTIFELKLG